MAVGKEQPAHSDDAEIAVLGAIMLRNNAYYKALEHLPKPEMFYNNKHLLIYQALGEMITEGKEADIVTLGEHLRTKGQEEQTGGRSYIAKIQMDVATSTNIEQYALIVLQHYIQRKQVIIIGEGYKKRKEQNFVAPMQYIREEFDKLDNYVFSDKPEEETEHNQRVAEDIKKRARGEIEILETPLYELNRQIEIEVGDMIIVGARPSMGKTALALTFAEYWQTKDKVLFLSAEMTKDTLTKRRLTYYSGYTFKELNRDENKVDKALELLTANTKHNLIIDDKNITYDTIRGKAKRAAEQGCKYVIYDYAQLIPSRGSSKREEVGKISNLIKQVGKDYGLVSLVLAQLSRESAKNKVGMALIPAQEDLKEAGELEQDADIILMLHRPEKYSDKPLEIGGEFVDVQGLGLIKVAKQRNGDAQQLIRTQFDGKRMKFSDFVPEEYAKYID